MKKTFVVTDNHNNAYTFVGSEEQIRGLQELCMSTDFANNLIKMYDEVGIFSIPLMQGIFTPNEDNDYIRKSDIPQWMKDNMPGFRLEFIDEDGTPYFSTCDGLEIWYKENYDWFSEVLHINQQISDLNAKILNSSKSEIKKCEFELALAYKKLDDMDFDCVDVIEYLSTPISRYRPEFEVRHNGDLEYLLELSYSIDQ